ncbi:MAG TPA: MOSC domain-containing protein [Acidimicrobiaceae bacterium]|nr:MOSC domain-containing protein [Acidimicrobiaceae bacterium]
MHVAEIWQYPVKTMIGGRVNEAALDQIGIVGDRTWAVRDLEAGTIGNARKHGALMQYEARPVAGGQVEILCPDGTTVRSDDPLVHDVLSAAFGKPLALQARQPASEEAFYRRPPFGGGDPMAELREIFAREADEPLPDFTKFAPEVMEFETPPGAFYDCYPLLLLTTSALRSLAEAVPDSVIDVRRFRPSLVIDSGDAEGHPEFGWDGHRFAIGTAVVEVINDCPRCAAITKEISPDIPTDRSILRHVVRDLGQAVGAYARVVEPGVVRVGDEMRPL